MGGFLGQRAKQSFTEVCEMAAALDIVRFAHVGSVFFNIQKCTSTQFILFFYMPFTLTP